MKNVGKINHRPYSEYFCMRLHFRYMYNIANIRIALEIAAKIASRDMSLSVNNFSRLAASFPKFLPFSANRLLVIYLLHNNIACTLLNSYFKCKSATFTDVFRTL